MERDASGPGTWASSIVGATQGFKISKDSEAVAEDTVGGFLRHSVMQMFNHVPVSKGDATGPCIIREGGYKGGQGQYKLIIKINEVGGVSVDAEDPDRFSTLFVIEPGDEGVAGD